MTGHWPYAGFVAHRGGGALAPENTLAAFETGARHGFRIAECDVKLSGDDVAFLLHDDTVGRTSNGHGEAAKLSYAEIAKLDAGSWFDRAFAGERMPTLALMAQTVERLEMLVNIEIKPSSGREAVTGEFVAAESAQLWKNRTPPLLSSFSDDALAAAQAAARHLPRGLLLREVSSDWRGRVERLACESVHVLHTALTAANVAEFRTAGLRVMAYTVNDPERARMLLDWGVDAVCTDRLDAIGPG